MKLSFNNNPSEKDELDALILMHEEADNFRQGITWDEKIGKGCSIACVNHNYSHEEIAEKYGVPLFYVKNADSIFEGLRVEESRTFTREYWQHVPIGEDGDYFKSLYHFICVNQIKEQIKIIDDTELKSLLVKCIELHSKRSNDFDALKKQIFTRAYANANAYAYIKANANAYAYANAYVKANANAYTNANAYANVKANAYANVKANAYDYAYAYAYDYANANANDYANTYKFTKDITIVGLQMSKDELNDYLKGEIT